MRASDTLTTEVINIEPTAALLAQMTRQLQEDGFYCLENALNPELLQRFQHEVRALVQRKGQRYFSLINPFKNRESVFHVLQQSQRLHGFLHGLVHACTHAQAEHRPHTEHSEPLNVLRVVTGNSGNAYALRFHYDASIITMLIPVIIPKGPIQCCGHLLALMNLRHIRKSSITNFAEKVLMQNILTQKLLGFGMTRRLHRYVQELSEGNIYFFYGYRTLHANLPVDPSYLRATLLFHYGNPHQHSRLIRAIAYIRHWRERRNCENNLPA